MYNWGVVGCGNIAHSFAESLMVAKNASLYAVSSRSIEKAEAFGKQYNARKSYGNYEALFEDSNVDIVYIATPHTTHSALSIMALKLGKAVLCEKPMSINTLQTRAVFAAARASDSFYMEAMWMYFLPAIQQVKEWVSANLIGEIKKLQADFCFQKAFDPNTRLFDKNLGGGALLDVGIYPIALSYLLFEEEPIEVNSLAHLGESGVDEQSVYSFKYANGGVAQLSAAISIDTMKEARIYGEKGYIVIPDFWRAQRVIVCMNNEVPVEHSFSYQARGFQFEAEEVMACLDKGKMESSIMTHKKSLHIMQTMDKLRQEWGLKYPME